MSEEIIEKSKEILELGGKHYPLWEIVREIGILAGIDGKKIPTTSMNDDWLHAGMLNEMADQGDGEAKREL
ncbi:MAG: hypothetical protein JW821_16560 [Deltaproteobacteria bacterium]|nr:hypothetical protein [Deltaproteobacteria bacterium]